MKKTAYIFLIAALFLTVRVSAETKDLLILHTNDTHSCILPLSTELKDTMQAGRGGYLRRIEMLKQERAKNPKLLLIDSGDFSQGSPYYNEYKGDLEIDLMNEMRYDVSVVGNHEFDFGVENLARLVKRANFPILCANYDFTGTACEGLIKPYTIIKRDGVKIGLIGLSPHLEGLVAANTRVGVGYNDPIEAAVKWETYLKENEKCDVIIIVSHLGWGDFADMDKYLISKTRYTDLVLGGHTHSYFKDIKWVMNANDVPVPDDQNGKNAIFVGKIKLTLESE